MPDHSQGEMRSCRTEDGVRRLSVASPPCASGLFGNAVSVPSLLAKLARRWPNFYCIAALLPRQTVPVASLFPTPR